MDTGNKFSRHPLCTCQICGAAQLHEVEGFAALPRITSDCRSYAAGGHLFVCLACGGVQKLVDAQWLREIGGIYEGYEPYYQSGGDEQIVFDRVTGGPRRRSDVILERLVASQQLGIHGHALDVGCGNGATLATMSAVLAGWTLSGHELGNGALSRLSRIPRFVKLYTGSLDVVDKSFDLVTLIHSLEHFPSPMDFLKQLRTIVGEGQLFIEVCNVEENPFDILVADHLMHFSPATLKRLLECAGYNVVSAAADWIPKEISLLVKAGGEGSVEAAPGMVSPTVWGEEVCRRMAAYVEWLKKSVELVTALACGEQPLGIFGTSIAATWLAGQMGERISFFVDEDESRVGKEHLGRPIIRPNEIHGGGIVYLALAPGIAGVIAERFATLPCTLVLPPPMRIN